MRDRLKRKLKAREPVSNVQYARKEMPEKPSAEYLAMQQMMRTRAGVAPASANAGGVCCLDPWHSSSQADIALPNAHCGALRAAAWAGPQSSAEGTPLLRLMQSKSEDQGLGLEL